MCCVTFKTMNIPVHDKVEVIAKVKFRSVSSEETEWGERSEYVRPQRHIRQIDGRIIRISSDCRPPGRV